MCLSLLESDFLGCDILLELVVVWRESSASREDVSRRKSHTGRKRNETKRTLLLLNDVLLCFVLICDSPVVLLLSLVYFLSELVLRLEDLLVRVDGFLLSLEEGGTKDV